MKAQASLFATYRFRGVPALAAFLSLILPTETLVAQPPPSPPQIPHIQMPGPVFQPSIPRYTPPQANSQPRVPYPPMSQAREQMNQGQMAAQQRQLQAATAQANSFSRMEHDRVVNQQREIQTRQIIEAARRDASATMSRMELQRQMQATTADLSRWGGSSYPVARMGVPLNGQGSQYPRFGISFEEAANKAQFYFPNDLGRQYRWVKISGTTARNLVNGREAELPAETTVLVVPGTGESGN